MPTARPAPPRTRRPRRYAGLFPVCLLGMMLAALALSASAQKVAPRLTGALVVEHLDKAAQAVKARAASAGDDRLPAIATQLQQMQDRLTSALGDDADEPLETIGRSERAAAVRADAAAKRVQAWLDASASACTREDASAMLAAVTATLKQLAADTSDQKAPLPMIDGVETLDKRPLFVLPQGEGTAKFVLTGANLVDTRCANPEVVALGPDGKPAAVQPRLVAAQPGRVELAWSGAGKLAPGTYTLRLTAQRKAFLFGCGSEPPALAVLQIAPPLAFTVSYALSATCAAGTESRLLDSGTLPTITGRGHTETRTINVAACQDPSSYTVAASVRAPDGQESKYGPVTQSAAATIITGLGNGLTLRWEPSLHQLLVNSGKRTCKGVY